MTDRDTSIIARTVTRSVLPIVLVTAVALLLRGHNLPGGGFIAGVLTVTGIALVYIIYGREVIRRDLLRTAPEFEQGLPGVADLYGAVFTAGLALATMSGLAAIALGRPFLTQGVLFVKHVPIYHELEVASALVFDLGVYFVVVGALLTILSVVGAE